MVLQTLVGHRLIVQFHRIDKLNAILDKLIRKQRASIRTRKFTAPNPLMTVPPALTASDILKTLKTNFRNNCLYNWVKWVLPHDLSLSASPCFRHENGKCKKEKSCKAYWLDISTKHSSVTQQFREEPNIRLWFVTSRFWWDKYVLMDVSFPCNEFRPIVPCH